MWCNRVILGSESKVINQWIAFAPDTNPDPVQSLASSLEAMLFSPVDFCIHRDYVSLFRDYPTFRIPKEEMLGDAAKVLFALVGTYDDAFAGRFLDRGGVQMLNNYTDNVTLDRLLHREMFVDAYLTKMGSCARTVGELDKLKRFILLATQDLLGSCRESIRREKWGKTPPPWKLARMDCLSLVFEKLTAIP
jgi:hypothetical protein